MKLKFSIPLAVTTACLAFAQTSVAQTYTETGDAGDLPATAQIVTGVGGVGMGSAGVTFTAITGSTTATNGLYDGDMFEFSVTLPGTYTFSTNNFVAGKNDFDTQLFLFNTAGVGVAANDDAASGGELSTLVMTLTTVGNYYLLLDGSGRYPVDSTGALIFPNYEDGTTDPSGTYAAKSTLPIFAHTGNTNEGGAYNITVTYAPPLVPEPGTYAFVLAGLAGLAFVGKFRRQAVR